MMFVNSNDRLGTLQAGPSQFEGGFALTGPVQNRLGRVFWCTK
jgi:hypothetical protein